MLQLKIKAMPLGWLAVAGGVAATAAVYAAGFLYAGSLASPTSFTPLARLAVLAATAFVAGGAALLVKQQQRDTSAIRDVWLLAGSLAALSWVVLVRPALGDGDTAFTAFRIAFALLDIAVAALLVLLAVPQSGYKLRRVRVAGMVHLAANNLFAMTGLRSTFSFTSPLVIAYLGLYMVLAGMGLRGRLQRLAHPEPDLVRPTRAVLRSGRVAVLSSVPIVSGVAVALAVAAEPRASAMAVAAVAAVLMTLAVVRLRDLHTADSKLVDSLRDQCDELQERNGRLAVESERALASLREATDFLADMTERVASPLNGVLESSDELREAMASAPQIEPAVDTLIRSSDTLLFIVNDLLGIAEATARPVAYAPTSLSPLGLVTTVGEAFVDAAASRGVDLVVIADDGVPAEAVGQRAHIESVLRIFLDNAVKFSNKGEIELNAAFIDRRTDGSVVVRFSVHDTGVGMTREHRQALLVPRDAGDDAPARRYRRKPRGLALVPELVELLGGDWGVESELGRGSTFWFTAVLQPVTEAVAPPVPAATDAPARERESVEASSLETEPSSVHEPEPVSQPIEPIAADEPEPEPIHAAEPEPEPEPVYEPEPDDELEPEPEPEAVEAFVAEEPEPQSRVFGDPQGESIENEEPEVAFAEPEPIRMQGRLLLADDNPLNRRVTLAALRSIGFRVEVATNGAEAVEALMVGSYDAVLMDCEMPVLDGFDATVAIRDQERDARHTPIIALTAHATHDDQLRAAAAGMDDFMAKPFDTRTLLSKLAKWVPQDTRTPAN